MSGDEARTNALRSGWPVSAATTRPRMTAVPGFDAVSRGGGMPAAMPGGMGGGGGGAGSGGTRTMSAVTTKAKATNATESRLIIHLGTLRRRQGQERREGREGKPCPSCLSCLLPSVQFPPPVQPGVVQQRGEHQEKSALG